MSSTRRNIDQVRVKFAHGSPGVRGPLNVPSEARSVAPEVEPRAAQRASHGSAYSLALYVGVV